jgi:aminoglycoside 6-adenylyltransferase
MNEQLLNKVMIWANAEESVRVIIMEGSRARRDHAIDRFSDYDLNLYVTDMTRLIQDDTWIAQLGRIWAMEKEEEPDGIFGRLVLFEGGQDIDFKLLPIHFLHEFVQQQVLPDDYHRGYKVVLDKDGITSQLPPPTYKAIPQPKPSEEEFRYAVNVFWFELFHLVKYLHRNELWCVKVRDACIMRRLRQMIEWHAQACHEWKYDTWIVGKYMQSWVEPDLWQAFFEIFARFDKADSWRAVCALIPLYQRLASETAQRLSYAYPSDTDQAVSTFILCNSPV